MVIAGTTTPIGTGVHRCSTFWWGCVALTATDSSTMLIHGHTIDRDHLRDTLPEADDSYDCGVAIHRIVEIDQYFF